MELKRWMRVGQTATPLCCPTHTANKHPIMLKTAIAITAACLVTAVSAASMSPYAGQESRDIKALSAEDVQGYVSGKGMGLAKAAELNGYPGPSHVLGLATELALTPEQTQQTRVLFEQMQGQVRLLNLSVALLEQWQSLLIGMR